MASYFDDGESSRRVDVQWVSGDAIGVRATAQFWSDYDVVDLERRWYWRQANPDPFLTVSTIWQNQHGAHEAGRFCPWCAREVAV